jgi:hypothetical protein
MDTSGFIFVRPAKRDQALKDFATHIFRWLEISSFKERWVGKSDDQQFVGSAVGIEVVIGENFLNSYKGDYKKKELEKYLFLIHLIPQSTGQSADYLVQHAHTLAWRLSHEGFRCFVPKNMTTVSSEHDGMVYDF